MVLIACFTAPTFANAGLDESAVLEAASKIIGPIKNDDNCSTCHTLETDAWQFTRHFATFKDRHRSEEAKVILAAMGERSMKRSSLCRDCHYTTEAKNERLRASFGVSCESCHGAGRDWLAVHSKENGDLSASDLKWGTGKAEPAESRAKRLGAAVDLGMINSEMTYQIAKNCFGCHTVPDEQVVNRGGHLPGSDFELVSWSQGEVLHNFSSSEGAPNAPTNRPASIEKRRLLFLTGIVVDLETSLRNISNVKEQGGKFHIAMVDRANAAAKKLDSVLSVIAAPGIADVTANIPKPIGTDSAIDPNAPKGLADAITVFLRSSDGTNLKALDPMISNSTKGQPYGG